MRVTSWITKATDTHSEYIIIITFTLQQWLHERPSLLHSTYIACLAKRTAASKYYVPVAIELIQI